jgi:IclR family acetate operon transcriptional repressor
VIAPVTPPDSRGATQVLGRLTGQLVPPAPAIVATASSPGAAGRSVLEGAFGLLEAVERAGEAGLTKLAAECGLPKTTAHRLLEQLAELGAVERHRGNYRVGPQMFHLGRRWQPHPGLRSAAREPIRRLAELTGAAVGIAVLWKGRILVLEWAPGKGGEPSGEVQRGTTWPWRTAAGKVLVASAGPVSLPGPPPLSWRQEAIEIRDRGVAFDREELMAGVCCVAVPLYGAGEIPMASLCVVTNPAHHLERLAHAAQRTSRVIGAELRRR